MRQLGMPSAADGGPSRGRSLHASPLGSPRAGKAGEFMPIRLTERQQLALALEESLKASQPQPSPSKNNNTGSGESSATRARNISQPAHLRRSSSEAAKRSSEKATTSTAPVQRTFSAAGSDTESSAGVSGSREPSFGPRRNTDKSQPSTTAPSRKRKLGCEDADVSSSSQCGDQSLKKDTRIRVDVEANAFSGPEKEVSFSDTSRHSHSTSLPSTPRGQQQRIATDSADSASPCASPAHSQGPCKAAPAEDEEDKSQRSSAGAFTDVHDTSMQPGTEKAHAQQGDPKPGTAELALEERPGSAAASKRNAPAGPNNHKRSRDVVKEEPSGSKKQRKASVAAEDATISAVHKAQVKEEPSLDPVTPGKSKRESQHPGKARSPSLPPADPDAPHADPEHPSSRGADLCTPPLSSAKPRAHSHSPDGGLPSAPRPLNWTKSRVRIALNLKKPPAASSGPADEKPPVASTSGVAVSEEGRREPASTSQAPAPWRVIVRKPGSTKGDNAKSGGTPRRSGRVAALDSEPSSPMGVVSPSAAAAAASAAPFGRAPPQGKGSAKPKPKRRAGISPTRGSIDATYAPPGSSSRASAIPEGQRPQPVRMSARGQGPAAGIASQTSLARKLRSQEPAPEVMDPFARPPMPTKKGRGGLFHKGCSHLYRISDTADAQCSFASTPAPSGSLSPPHTTGIPLSLPLSSSLSRALAARATPAHSPSAPGDSPPHMTHRREASHPAAGDPGAQSAKGNLAAVAEALVGTRDESEMSHLGAPAPMSPFAGWPLPAHLERQPSAVLSENLLQVSKSLEALHGQESSRWEGSIAAESAATLDPSAPRRPSDTSSKHDSSDATGGSFLPKHDSADAVEGRFLQLLPSGRLARAQQMCRGGSAKLEGQGTGSFMSACSKLHRSSTSGGLQIRASLPPLFRGSSNVHRLQSAYEDMLQRQALEREAVDGMAGYLCPQPESDS